MEKLAAKGASLFFLLWETYCWRIDGFHIEKLE
jgi:hypothetical protein